MNIYSIRYYVTYHLNVLHRNIIKRHILKETGIDFDTLPFFEFVYFLEQKENTEKYLLEYYFWKKDYKYLTEQRKKWLNTLIIRIKLLKRILKKTNLSEKYRNELNLEVLGYENEYDLLYQQVFRG